MKLEETNFLRRKSAVLGESIGIKRKIKPRNNI